MPPKEAEPFVRLSVNLPAPLHGAIRAIAASKGETISEYVRAALEDAYSRDRYGAERKASDQ